ncbi:hypothetical protein DM02DRAFT_647704 [Periconia macrospinosa]|uniref:Uncharacterized protein n=1 Tax=Periconia macrospinosa TaxID=97972 RepID=A0A2V1EDC1_9PLEO|nr:hypothetical protein DM02DRAFT_647704 [Periconia macrospinosa]
MSLLVQQSGMDNPTTDMILLAKVDKISGEIKQLQEAQANVKALTDQVEKLSCEVKELQEAQAGKLSRENKELQRALAEQKEQHEFQVDKLSRENKELKKALTEKEKLQELRDALADKIFFENMQLQHCGIELKKKEELLEKSFQLLSSVLRDSDKFNSFSQLLDGFQLIIAESEIQFDVETMLAWEVLFSRDFLIWVVGPEAKNSDQHLRYMKLRALFIDLVRRQPSDVQRLFVLRHF